MKHMEPKFSPKQVAQALGVSESSLKRWCDQGRIAVQHTPGGHRRISLESILEFVRSTTNQLLAPELLGLPARSGKGAHTFRWAANDLCEALIHGNGAACRKGHYEF